MMKSFFPLVSLCLLASAKVPAIIYITAPYENECKGYIRSPRFQLEEQSEANLQQAFIDLYSFRESAVSMPIRFGGPAGVPLHENPACQVKGLVEAYQSAIDTFELKVLHIELSEFWTTENFEVIKQVAAAKPQVPVWWTLPLVPLEEAKQTDFFGSFISSGVPIDHLEIDTLPREGSVHCLSEEREKCTTDLAHLLFEKAVQFNATKRLHWTADEDILDKEEESPMASVAVKAKALAALKTVEMQAARSSKSSELDNGLNTDNWIHDLEGLTDKDMYRVSSRGWICKPGRVPRCTEIDINNPGSNCC